MDSRSAGRIHALVEYTRWEVVFLTIFVLFTCAFLHRVPPIYFGIGGCSQNGCVRTSLVRTGVLFLVRRGQTSGTYDEEEDHDMDVKAADGKEERDDKCKSFNAPESQGRHIFSP